MAPLALEHICEEISTTVRKDGYKGLNKEGRAFSLGLASFFAGGSAGLALHVHNQKFMPKCFNKKLVIVPFLMAMGSSFLIYRLSLNSDVTLHSTALHWHRMPYRKVGAITESG